MTYRNFPSWLILMGLITALGPLAIDMYLPAFVEIADGLDTTTNTIELTLASYFIGIALGQSLYGPLSDRFGRKPPLIFGLALYIAASIACALVTTAESLLLWRFVQAMGGCAGMVIARAVVRDKTEPQEAAKAFSMLILVLGVAPILAPILGTVVLSLGSWRWIFLFQGLAAAACMTWLILGLEETHPGEERKLSFRRVFADYRELTQWREYMGFALTTGLAMGGFFAYLGSSPALLMNTYGLSPEQYAIIFGVNAAGFIALSQFNTWLLHRWHMRQVLRVVIWVLPVSGLTMAAAALLLQQPPLWLLLPLIFVFISFIGLINPNAAACALSLPNMRVGTASALMGVMQFSIATLTTFGIGALPQTTAIPLAGGMALMGVLAFSQLRFVALPAAETRVALSLRHAPSTE
ncbi:MAG: multidrug effflux MFS transporter [Natronospirillum sp.]|uniref:multidrug effflux MFS transporter n=1 Tax=Natronospirillum sp. TaxID=2812955 RepID=UPI0025EA0750|nr:multidrug effflux MFS transporter [Natronospirillum sp.]MCH8553436.1 multidrug effflux MFS transporter [Natronospirillum sp.]